MTLVQKHVVPERRKERELAPTQSLLEAVLNVVVALPTHVRKHKPEIVIPIVAQVSNFSLIILKKSYVQNTIIQILLKLMTLIFI